MIIWHKALKNRHIEFWKQKQISLHFCLIKELIYPL